VSTGTGKSLRFSEHIVSDENEESTSTPREEEEHLPVNGIFDAELEQEKQLEDAQKLSWYHTQIQAFKSGIFKYLKVTVIVGVLLVLVSITMSFVLVFTALSSVRSIYPVIAMYSDMRSNLYSFTNNALSLSLSMAYGNSGIVSSLQERMEDIMEEAEEQYDELYAEAETGGNSEIIELWNTASLESPIYIEETGNSITETTSLYLLLNNFIRAGKNVAQKDFEFISDYSSLSTDTDVRFVLDNIEGGLLDDVQSIIDLYRDSTVSATNTYIYVLCAIVPTSLIASGVLIVSLFVYALGLVLKEKINVLQLFMAIPRESVIEIYKNYGGDVNAIKTRAQLHGLAALRSLELKLSGVKVNGMVAFLFRGICFFFILATLSVTIWIYGVVMLNHSYNSIDLITSRGKERLLLLQMNSFSKSTLLSSDLTISRETALASYDTAKESYLEQIVASEQLSSVNKLEFSSSDVIDIRLSRNCSGTIFGTCFGVYHVGQFLFARTEEITDMSESDAAESIELAEDRLYGEVSDMTTTFEPWLAIDHAEQSVGKAWFDAFMTILADAFSGTISTAKSIILIIFIVSIPSALFILVFIMLPLFAIETEHENTIKLLLLIPLNVIESTPEIKEFLVSGKLTSIEEKMQIMLEESRAKAEGILQAAADAIVTFDKENFTIDVFNAAAERMFGYSRAEIVKCNIGKIINEEDLKRKIQEGSEGNNGKNNDPDLHDSDKAVNDILATTKDGETFPVTLSMSKKATGGQYALFIRNLRQIKVYQQLIEDNNTLLFKMLPHSIALRIKNNISESEDIKLADKHEEVTIMFADIDKFTQHTNGMEAQEIATLLNSLVTTWDNLAKRYGVEKIKTIGDIYMAVSNCPEPDPNHAVTMIKFSEALVRSLEKFNQENRTDIHVRVGINTGSVVAGVLGLSKVTYDIWGASVNFASRMQSSGIIDTIQVTTSTYDLVKDYYPFVCRGDIVVKGNITIKAFIYNPLNPEAAKALIRKEAKLNETKEDTKKQSNEKNHENEKEE
jgi:PAS domain S-box-containing protein